MRLHTRHSTAHRPGTLSGFTLVETLVALAAGALLIGVVVAMSMVTAKSFFMMGSYEDLDAQSRHAVDLLGKDIRNSSQLLNYNTSSPEYLELTNATSREIDYISYYPGNGTLMLTNILNNGTTAVQMLLTNCDTWNFSIYTRAPNVSPSGITFYSATNAISCKMINMTWECSRTMLGSKFTTESVQTAQIVLRNKVQ